MHPVPTHTTATQYALGACFLLAGPAFGLAAAFLERQRGRPGALAALLSCGAAWAGWFIACVVAIVLFPGYPGSGTPSEPVAMLFVLPGLGTGALAVRAIAERHAPTRGTPAHTRRVLVVLAAATVALGLALAGAHRWLTTWPARRALPSGALVVFEEAIEDGFLPDFAYTLRARMTEAEFGEWMATMHLTPDPSEPGRFTREMGPECSCSASWVDGTGTFGSYCM